MKLKKVLAMALAGVMALSISPVAGKMEKVKAAGGDLPDMVTNCAGKQHSDSLKITNQGFKLEFDAGMTTKVDWDSPQVTVYSGTEYKDEADATDENWLMQIRSDNYANDRTGNRWVGDDNKPLTQGNAYVFSGSFSRESGGEATSHYTVEAYLMGESAIVIMKNETFTSVSRIAVNAAKDTCLSLIANYCNITNIQYTAGDNTVNKLADVPLDGYGNKKSDAIKVTEAGVLVSFDTKANEGATNNYNGACVFGYNGTTHGVAITTDTRLNTDAGSEDTLNGYKGTLTPSYGGSWDYYNTRKVRGIGSAVYAYLDGANLVIYFANDTFGSKVVVEGIDTSKDVTLKITGDNSAESNIYVSEGVADSKYNDLSYYKSNKTYPAKSGKAFAGWYSDAAFTTPISKETTTGAAYAKFVDDDLLDVKVQLTAGTTASSESTDARVMMAVDNLKYEKVGFEIAYDGRANTDPVESTKVYTGIGVEGSVDAVSKYFGEDAKYMLPYILRGIKQADFSKEYNVTAYWVTLDGTKVTGEKRVVKVTDGLS